MKKIEAIIRTAKFEEVLTELSKIGISFMTYSEVKGIGLEHAPPEQYRGTSFEKGFTPRTRLEIALAGDKVDAAVQCLLKVAFTGKVGDGKIFIYDIVDAYRIRTKEQGEKAL